ncbi:MAG: aspartate aminotransferase family protein [Bacteroidales bacterium]|nr:aspartate aminotransferase family protein [Bacteroidales bacterium]
MNTDNKKRVSKRFFWRYLAHTSTKPLAFYVKKAKGIYLYNEEDQPFIDCISGIAVSNLGHNSQFIKKSIIKQLSDYTHTMVYGEHIQDPQILLAKKLVELSDNKFEKVYFTNSGSESVDLALKLSLLYTRRNKIIACYNSYHGSTLAACSLKYTKKHRNFMSFEVDFIKFNCLNDLKKIDKNTACVIIEPIQGEAGYIPATLEFLSELKEICDRNKILLIFDEIQTALGRTGKFYAYQHYNVVPDILLLAKALGGGLPLGAVLSSKKIFATISSKYPLSHLTTFGGNPLSCASANAAIDLIVNKYIKTVPLKEKIVRSLLTHPLIKKVNGIGLMLGIELQRSDVVEKVIKYCYNDKILLDWFLLNNKSIRFAPPLIIKEDELKKICLSILNALNNCC